MFGSSSQTKNASIQTGLCNITGITNLYFLLLKQQINGEVIANAWIELNKQNKQRNIDTKTREIAKKKDAEKRCLNECFLPQCWSRIVFSQTTYFPTLYLGTFSLGAQYICGCIGIGVWVFFAQFSYSLLTKWCSKENPLPD